MTFEENASLVALCGVQLQIPTCFPPLFPLPCSTTTELGNSPCTDDSSSLPGLGVDPDVLVQSADAVSDHKHRSVSKSQLRLANLRFPMLTLHFTLSSNKI